LVFPWLPFLFEGGKKRLSDIEYLSIKENLGKRVDVKLDRLGVSQTFGGQVDLLVGTAGVGPNKDMYLAGASFSMGVTAETGGGHSVEIRLFANGVFLEGYIRRDVADEEEWDFVFKTKGIKVASNQEIKITIEFSDDTNFAVLCWAQIMLFEEDPGATPAV